jgi:hypothetical protein
MPLRLEIGENMVPVVSEAVAAAVSVLVERLLPSPAAGAGLVKRQARLDEEDVRKLVRQVVLAASNSDPAIRALEPSAGALLDDSLTATLMGLDAVLGMDEVQQAHLDPARLANGLRSAAPSVKAKLPEPAVAFHDAILNVCCVHIVDFFTRQPEFPARTAVENSQRLGKLLEDRTEEARAFEDHYRAGVVKKLDTAELFGLRLPREEQTYELSTAYVSLTLRWTGEETHRYRAGGGRRRREFGTELLPADTANIRVEDALGSRPRLLIEGPAGAGKTTLLRRLAVHACRGDDLPDQLAALRHAVPFLLPLRALAARDELDLPGPEQFIKVALSPLEGEKPERWVSSLLRAGRAVVLVDGVDEVADKHRAAVINWLEELTDQYPHARYILTSRPAAMQEDWRAQLRLAGFATARIEPMTRGQVEDFIDQWHRAARSSRPDDDTLARCAASLKAALVDRRDLARLATNPLLCAMLCALNRNNNDYLPHGRAALYNDALTMLLERRDREHGIETGTVRLNRDQIEPLLSRLAIWMTMNGRRTIPRRTATREIDEPLRRVHRGRGPGCPLAPETVLQHLVERSGLLQEPTVDLLEFRHPSFQDYLAAVEVFQREHLAHLLRNAHDPMYHDIAIMAAGQTQKDPVRQRDLLAGLVDRAAADEERSRQLWLLAAACIADLDMVDPDLAERIQDETALLLPPSDVDEAESVAGAGEFVIDLLASAARRGDLTPKEAAATIRAASLAGSEAAIPLLRSFRRRAYAQVQRELVAGWFRSTTPERYADEVLADAALEGVDVILANLDTLPLLPRLRGLTWLLMPSGTTDADLVKLATLTNLKTLSLVGTGVVDVSSLAALTNLKTLSLAGTGVADLSPLATLTNLKTLFLDGTEVTDLSPLATLTNLKRSH